MAKTMKKIKRIVNQSELARRIGVTPQYIGMLMSGKRTNRKRIAQIQEILSRELNGIRGKAA